MSYRNAIKVEQYTRFHETTGKPYKRWSVIVTLGSGSTYVKFWCRDWVRKEDALLDAEMRLGTIIDAAERAIRTLKKCP